MAMWQLHFYRNFLVVRGLAHSRALVHAVSDGDTWIVMYAPEYVCMPANVCTTVSMYVCMYILYCIALDCIVSYGTVQHGAINKHVCMHACQHTCMHVCDLYQKAS